MGVDRAVVGNTPPADPNNGWSRPYSRGSEPAGLYVDLHLDQPVEVIDLGSAVRGQYRQTEEHRLVDLWEMQFHEYSAVMEVGGVPFTVGYGSVSVVPPGTVVTTHFEQPSETRFVLFRPCETGRPRTVPVVQDAGSAAAALINRLDDAVSTPPGARAKVNADVWDVLWQVAELTDENGELPGIVADAVAHIERHLAHDLRVPDIAAELGLSHNHLTRQFKAATGRTVVAYIRGRRLERARQLLVSSTLPIGAVAAAVNIADIHSFNKACHLEFGVSPSAIRDGADVAIRNMPIIGEGFGPETSAAAR